MTAEELVETGTTAGRVRGRRRADGSIAFLGIPFAEPPVGELRFQAPVPHRPWDGVRDALEHGATAKREVPGEATSIPEPAIPGESTLNVNVFTPDLAGAVPVLVYIHGGGYTSGSPASPWYDGAAFARDGIVTVSVSYRLGFDGFGWISDAPSNRALRDWLLALEWVRDNVRSFGGDPGRVTIAGQSAGGSAVLTLLAMPAAQGLFHGAYAISPSDVAVGIDRAESLGRRLAELGGVEPTRAGLGALDELRIRDLQEQLQGDTLGAVLDPRGGRLPWAPVIDGELLRDYPVELLGRSGTGVPLVIGATDDEFSTSFDAREDELRSVPADAALERLGVPDETRRAWLAANPGLRESRGTARTLGRFLSDAVFRATVPRVLAARGDAPTWAYRFAWPSAVSGLAVHCLDLPFFFDCLAEEHVPALAGPRPPQELADAIHAAAVAFVRDGDPGWPRSGITGPTRVFALPDPAALESDSYASATALV